MALGCATAAAVGPNAWIAVATIAASCCIAAAAIIVATLREFTRTLFGAAISGLAIAMSRSGIELLRDDQWLIALQMLFIGATGFMACFAIARDSRKLRRLVLGVMRVAFAVLAVAYLIIGQPLAGLPFVVAALMTHRFYERVPKPDDEVREIVPGVLMIMKSTPISPGFGRFINRRVTMAIGFGLVSFLMAVGAFVVDLTLVGAALVVGGVACVGRGSQLMPHGSLWPAIQRRLQALTSDPGPVPSRRRQTF